MDQKFKIARLLLIEDCEADAEIFKFALKKNKFHADLDCVDNGKEALDYVFHRNKYIDKELPDLILLDINLPDINGIEILKQIKENEITKIIPVIILTSSKKDEDIYKSYSNYANCFMEKPLNRHSFLEIIENLENFWLNIVTLPRHE